MWCGRYPCPGHLKQPFLELAEESGVTRGNPLLEFCCYPTNHWLAASGSLGHSIKYFVSKANENKTIEMQPGKVVKEEIAETMSAGMSFFCRDLKEQWQIRQHPDFEESDEPT